MEICGKARQFTLEKMYLIIQIRLYKKLFVMRNYISLILE